MQVNDTPFPAPTKTPQQLRRSALQWQMAALDEQLGVLRTLDAEHSFGIENTAEVSHIVHELHDLLKSAEAISRDAKTLPQAQTLDRIKVFHLTVQRIKGEADRFNGAAVLRAKMRLKGALEDHKASAPDAGDGSAKPPADTDKLYTRASSCCFNAEASQYSAFAMQVNAICDLALELIYNAAADSGTQNS
jgi:hypothetical protein